MKYSRLRADYVSFRVADSSDDCCVDHARVVQLPQQRVAKLLTYLTHPSDLIIGSVFAE